MIYSQKLLSVFQRHLNIFKAAKQCYNCIIDRKGRTGNHVIPSALSRRHSKLWTITKQRGIPVHHVYFIREKKQIEVPEGTTVLEAERLAGLLPDAPCGGAGTCGKCRVIADGQNVRACQTRITKDFQIDTAVSSSLEDAVILTEGFSRPVSFRPGIAVHAVELKKTVPGDRRSDWERMLSALSKAGAEGAETFRPDPELASSLYERCRQGGIWYIAHTDREILDIRAEKRAFCFAAFDIGTTTLAGYLLDAADGRVLAVESRMNPQAQYGADVIMRADHALAHGTEALSRCIRQELDAMIGCLAAQAHRERTDILQICVVGNTCMHHLFLNLSPASLVHAPYTPAISQALTLPTAPYGLNVHPKGQLLMLPNIAGYVGADTSGCLLAIRPDQKEEITLLLDIGTNGEMILGNRDRLATCSTAAGPAFEGAKIECGMRGTDGAVDHVSFENGVWNYTTIGNRPAAGLCGSGLLDLTAQLLKHGFIDENGTLESGQEDPGTFLLVHPEDAGNDKGVYLTQKDIREVQLAKAAIAAGIRILMKTLFITEEDIRCLYIAGAFGNYMDPVSAGAIGLIPPSLTERIRPVGNAAGEGAKIALLNTEEWRLADRLAKTVEFVELAALPEFQDCFVDELEFPLPAR